MSDPQNFLSELTGSFAQPAAENPTVAMIEAAFEHHDVDWRYINCEVPPDKLADAVRGARAMNWAGFNCSLPHKVAVIQHLDGLGESAEIAGVDDLGVLHPKGHILGLGMCSAGGLEGVECVLHAQITDGVHGELGSGLQAGDCQVLQLGSGHHGQAGVAGLVAVLRAQESSPGPESAVGEGSAFRVYLPLTFEGTARSESKRIETPAPGGSGKILFVDDEEPIVRLGRLSLEKLGYRCNFIRE